MEQSPEDSPHRQSYAGYPSLRRRPAQRGSPPDFYVMQADSTGSYIEHWHAPQGIMQRVSAIRDGVRTGDVAYEVDGPQGSMQHVTAPGCRVRTGDTARELDTTQDRPSGSLRYGFRSPFSARSASYSSPSTDAQRSQVFHIDQADFQTPQGPKPFEGEEEAIRKSLEDQNEEAAVQKSLEDQVVAQQEAEAVRRSLEDQKIVQQEAEEHEVLLRALARQETLLTRFSEQRTDTREIKEQEDLVLQLRERLLALAR